jgi:hypothetical protein
MDTSIMEHTAEDLIAHRLQRAGLLVAKPKFDQNGADLLAFLDVNDGAKFCRIQCKGRSLRNSQGSSVKVPGNYVTDGLVVFLFVETGTSDETHLYCFLGGEIRANWARKDADYVLSITRSQFEVDLAPYAFDESRIREIVKAIINVNVVGEFRVMNHGYADIALSPLTLRASGTTGAPPTDATAKG